MAYLTPAFCRHIERAMPDIVSGSTDLSMLEALSVYESAKHIVTREVGGQIVAHAELRQNPVSPHRWTVSCAVEREHQGKGLGRAVLSEALAYADEHGAEYVDGFAWEHNTKVIALDLSLGFVEAGRVVDAYRRNGESYTQVLLVRRRP